jgi:peptidoglycan/LPS O-acetylase OafA/YrhL
MSDKINKMGRVTELDALRGVAALGVLLYHYTIHYDTVYGLVVPFDWPFEVGRYGVHLFFMISGFVIFMTLERTNHALDFVVSRFSRLFPAYWAAMLITLVAVQIEGLPGQEVSTLDALVNLTMLSDFFNAQEVDGSYWTLQIELFFYMQMLVWYVVGGFAHIRIIIGGWLLIAAVYGIEARLGVHLSYTLREVLIVRYIPFFAAGILLYRAYDSRDRAWQTLVALGACVFSTWAVWSWREGLVISIFSAIFLAVIFRKARFLSRQPFLFLGAVSYTLYLLHMNLGFIIISKLEMAGLSSGVSICFTLIIMLILASVLTKLVEKPAMRGIRRIYGQWRTKLDKRPSREAV